MTYRSAWLLPLLTVWLAVPAAAQSPELSQSAALGVRWAHPADRPADEGSPGLDASWRRRLAPHAVLEANFGWWRAIRSQSDPTVQVAQRSSFYTAGVNVLGVVRLDRLSIFAGGGPALFIDHDRYTVYRDDVARSTSIARSVSLQAVLEFDVLVGNRFSLFAGARGELRRFSDIDSAVLYPTLGIRTTF